MARESFESPAVAAAFAAFPDSMRSSLGVLRGAIFEVAAEIDGVGRLEETLKWGQPSYLTTRPKSGTTIRIGRFSRDTDECALFVHCQTTLVGTYRTLYSDILRFDGNRAIVFDADDSIFGDHGSSVSEGRADEKRVRMDALKHCIAMALTYHMNKKG